MTFAVNVDTSVPVLRTAGMLRMLHTVYTGSLILAENNEIADMNLTCLLRSDFR